MEHVVVGTRHPHKGRVLHRSRGLLALFQLAGEARSVVLGVDHLAVPAQGHIGGIDQNLGGTKAAPTLTLAPDQGLLGAVGERDELVILPVSRHIVELHLHLIGGAVKRGHIAVQHLPAAGVNVLEDEGLLAAGVQDAILDQAHGTGVHRQREALTAGHIHQGVVVLRAPVQSDHRAFGVLADVLEVPGLAGPSLLLAAVGVHRDDRGPVGAIEAASRGRGEAAPVQADAVLDRQIARWIDLSVAVDHRNLVIGHHDQVGLALRDELQSTGPVCAQIVEAFGLLQVELHGVRPEGGAQLLVQHHHAHCEQARVVQVGGVDHQGLAVQGPLRLYAIQAHVGDLALVHLQQAVQRDCDILLRVVDAQDRPEEALQRAAVVRPGVVHPRVIHSCVIDRRVVGGVDCRVGLFVEAGEHQE